MATLLDRSAPGVATMSLRRIVVWVVADRTSIAGFGAVTVMLSLTDAGIAVIVTVVIVPETTLSVTSGDVTCFPIAATRYIPIGTAAKRNTPCESVFDDRVRDDATSRSVPCAAASGAPVRARTVPRTPPK